MQQRATCMPAGRPRLPVAPAVCKEAAVRGRSPEQRRAPRLGEGVGSSWWPGLALSLGNRGPRET